MHPYLNGGDVLDVDDASRRRRCISMLATHLDGGDVTEAAMLRATSRARHHAARKVTIVEDNLKGLQHVSTHPVFGR
ncbi:MAG TPA: hypothetical protein VIZ30_11400, partial [Pseudomonadales bacterium]